MKDDGTPGATRVEEGVMLGRPTQSGLAPVLEKMADIKVKEEDISEQLKGKKSGGFFGNMFAAPVYEGGSAPTKVQAGTVTLDEPAAPAGQEEQKQSEWI